MANENPSSNAETISTTNQGEQHAEVPSIRFGTPPPPPVKKS